MQLIFRGDPLELARGAGLSRQSVTIEGVTFVMGVPTDASGISERMRGKLAKNTHFEVVAEESPSEPESEAAAEEREAAELAERLKAKRGKKAE